MMDFLGIVGARLVSLSRSGAGGDAESLFLRQRLIVVKRSDLGLTLAASASLTLARLGWRVRIRPNLHRRLHGTKVQ